jgi:hypothetical protein
LGGAELMNPVARSRRRPARLVCLPNAVHQRRRLLHVQSCHPEHGEPHPFEALFPAVVPGLLSELAVVLTVVLEREAGGVLQQVNDPQERPAEVVPSSTEPTVPCSPPYRHTSTEPTVPKVVDCADHVAGKGLPTTDSYHSTHWVHWVHWVHWAGDTLGSLGAGSTRWVNPLGTARAPGADEGGGN